MYDLNDPMVIAFILDLLTNENSVPGIVIDWLDELGLENLPDYEQRTNISWWLALEMLVEHSNPGMNFADILEDIEDRLSLDLYSIDIIPYSTEERERELPWEYPNNLYLFIDGKVEVSPLHYARLDRWSLGYRLGNTTVVFNARLAAFFEFLENDMYTLLSIFFTANKIAGRNLDDIRLEIQKRIDAELTLLETEHPEPDDPDAVAGVNEDQNEPDYRAVYVDCRWTSFGWYCEVFNNFGTISHSDLLLFPVNLNQFGRSDTDRLFNALADHYPEAQIEIRG